MKRLKATLLLALCVAATSCAQTTTTTTESDNTPIKNVIFLIGDGMGLAQASMTMIENGYKPTAFDRADNIALIKTYSANNRVTDSAAAGTALACGNKTNNGMVGVTPQLDTCYSIAKAAKQVGKSTGLVAACTIQHATPAAFYAHVNHRDDFEQITKQLANNDYIDLAIGGGAVYFDKCYDGVKYADCATKNGFNIVRTMDDLESAPAGRLLGLLDDGNIADVYERGDYLPRATKVALDRLSKNDKGFFLMVEGSQIDWACHKNNAERCLDETIDFCNTVEVAMEFADNNPGTLIVITADHETGGLSMVSGDSDFKKSDSGINYKFSTGSHSGILVPVYTYGTGAEQINGVMENTELSKKMRECIEQ